MKRFNNWIGDKLADYLSTMFCFYLITIAILATLFFQRPEGVQGWLLFWVTVFFQGVALPLLGYVAKKAGEKQEILLQETHDAVMAELKEQKQLQAAQEYQLAQLRRMNLDLRQVLKKHVIGSETNV